MTRAATILLILTIAFANAICVCAMPTSSVKQPSATTTPPACHKQKASKPADQHNQPAPHDCAHCTGVASADASVAKTSAPPMTLLDAIFISQHSLPIIATTTTSFASLDHTGLSPPARGRTLLDLACSLNT